MYSKITKTAPKRKMYTFSMAIIGDKFVISKAKLKNPFAIKSNPAIKPENSKSFKLDASFTICNYLPKTFHVHLPSSANFLKSSNLALE